MIVSQKTPQLFHCLQFYQHTAELKLLFVLDTHNDYDKTLITPKVIEINSNTIKKKFSNSSPKRTILIT